MQLEEYFDFEEFAGKFGPVRRIRIKGHRISLENVVRYFSEGQSPEVICREIYPGLPLECVYAAITYYLHNRDFVESYMKHVEEIGDKHYQEYLAQPESDLLRRLKAAKAERDRAMTQLPSQSPIPMPSTSVQP